MKKVLVYLIVGIALIGIKPFPAYADLQCGSSFDNYSSFVSIQNAQSCFSDPNTPNAVVYDTSTNTYTTQTGQAISKPTGVYKCLPPGNTSVVSTVYSPADCNGQLFDSTQGNPIQNPPPTNPTPSAPTPTGSNILSYTPLEPLPGGSTNYTGKDAFAQYLKQFLLILLGIGAMVAVVTLVIGGVTYMVSESIGKKFIAKERIQAAVIGLLLLLGSYLILNTINPNLVSIPLLGGPTNTSGAPAAANSNAAQSTPTSDQTAQCESPNGVVSGKHIQYSETGWFCQ